MLKWGSTEVTAVNWGSTACTEVYWGSTKVFPTYIICTIVCPSGSTRYYISCDGVGTADHGQTKTAEIIDFTNRKSCFFYFPGRHIYLSHSGLTDPSTDSGSRVGYGSGTLYFYYTKGSNANISCWLKDST